MKVAVVVPFHAEPVEWLRACFESVAQQLSPAAIIAVGDGVTAPDFGDLIYKRIELPQAHRDGGAAARAIGAIEAVNSGFDAVAFLDGDNWFSPQHIGEMIRLHRASGASICTASLSVVRIDGTPFDPELPVQSDGEKHADTSTIFVTREAFPLLANWALIPPELGAICDWVWWQLAKGSGYKRAHSALKTVFYRNRYAAQYRLLRETPPPGTKEFEPLQIGNYSIRVPAMGIECEITPQGGWRFRKPRIALEPRELSASRCAICGSIEGVRQFAVTVDGDELRAVALLCAEHGDAHLLNVGRVLGSLFARVNDPVVDCGEPAPVGKSRCIRGQGHTGHHQASPLEGWANVGDTRVPK